MPDQHSSAFIAALNQNDRQALSLIPKSDLHNHGLLGSRRNKLEARLGKKLPAPGTMRTIAEMDQYLFTVLAPHLIDRKGFIYGIGAAMEQAVQEGVTLLEMSIDSGFIGMFPGGAATLVEMLREIHQNTAPQLTFIPQLGLNRGTALTVLNKQVAEALETGYFRSVDLYGDELVRPPESFKEIYRMASKAGLRLAAHAGEFGDAVSVQHTVETLELQLVQHGIAAAGSPPVMRWLKDHHIQLNICPSSNLALGRVAALRTHPIRILYDQGVNVTLNTDDLMIFDQSICDEYVNLFRVNLFSAEELDIIRLQGLASPKII